MSDSMSMSDGDDAVRVSDGSVSAVPQAEGKGSDGAPAASLSLDHDDGDAERLMHVVGTDGTKHEMTVRQSSISTLIKTSTEQDKASEVPLPGVKPEALVKIVEFMKRANGTDIPIIDKPLRSKVMADVVHSTFAWAAKWIDDIGDDRQLLYDVILVGERKRQCFVLLVSRGASTVGTWFRVFVVSP